MPKSTRGRTNTMKTQDLDKLVTSDDYAKRVSQLEAEGMTTSDAQAVADVEVSKGTLLAHLKKEA